MKLSGSIRLAALLCATAGVTHADLIGINYSTGDVFSISTVDASTTFLGRTDTGIMGVDRDQNGDLLTITDGLNGSLGVLDENNWQIGEVGNLGAGFTFEGGLAVSGSGEIFGASRLAEGGRAIFQISRSSGDVMRSTVLSRPDVDLNGMQFRSDGVMVAIDALAGDFVSIDTSTGLMTHISSLETLSPGAVGGLALQDGLGYYITGGPVSGSEGDNSLYSIDFYTGEQRFIGTLDDVAGAGFGIGALVGTTVPSPGGLPVLGLAGVILGTRRRRR